LQLNSLRLQMNHLRLLKQPQLQPQQQQQP